MAMVKCKECGAAVSDTAKACPACGAARTPRGTAWKWLGALALLAAAYFAYWLVTMRTPMEDLGRWLS